MGDIIISDSEIKKITSTPGVLEVILQDYKGANWKVLIDELIAFESIGAEGVTLSELIVRENSDYKDKIMTLLPDEADLKTDVYIFRAAWSDIPVLQAVGASLKVESLDKE